MHLRADAGVHEGILENGHHHYDFTVTYRARLGLTARKFYDKN